MSMPFVKVASTKDLQPGAMKAVEAEGKEILLANIDNQYYAIGNRCTHMSCLLSDGTLRGENVTCPCHLSSFNVKTGAVIKSPARIPEKTYGTKTEAEDILVDIEAAGQT
jgi:nitrite reductase/ring-hydroxylating ferredoxin subunit